MLTYVIWEQESFTALADLPSMNPLASILVLTQTTLEEFLELDEVSRMDTFSGVLGAARVVSSDAVSALDLCLTILLPPARRPGSTSFFVPNKPNLILLRHRGRPDLCLRLQRRRCQCCLEGSPGWTLQSTKR